GSCRLEAPRLASCLVLVLPLRYSFVVGRQQKIYKGSLPEIHSHEKPQTKSDRVRNTPAAPRHAYHLNERKLFDVITNQYTNIIYQKLSIRQTKILTPRIGLDCVRNGDRAQSISRCGCGCHGA